MEKTSTAIKIFFEIYQKANENFDVEQIGSLYAENFLFCQPQGAQAIKKEAFLHVLPKRKGFFQMIGLKSSTITELEETSLDEQYIQIKATWKMHYEKEQEKPITDYNTTTYILYKKNNVLQIVMQIDHQDLMQKVQSLGLLPKTQ